MNTYSESAAKTPGSPPETQYPIPENNTANVPIIYDKDLDGRQIPKKTMRITNAAPFTVYPIMRSGNENTVVIKCTGEDNGPCKCDANGFCTVGFYDPYDPPKTEYRGFIGYKGNDGKCYFGLQPGDTITIRIPLVFWDAARIGIGTDGQYLPKADGSAPIPNPIVYKADSQHFILPAEALKSAEGSCAKEGVVMWYRSALGAPAPDALDQLLEWTIRDKGYLSDNPDIKKRRGGGDLKDQGTLINYDVSYVDNMFLPVAIEALDVAATDIPEANDPSIYNLDAKSGPFGWVGSIKSIEEIQALISQFTAEEKNTLLGAYFGGKGWPYYNIPLNPLNLRKIPAGRNIFGQSPWAKALSVYDGLNNHFMLSSGGTEAFRLASIAGGGVAKTGSTITLLWGDDYNQQFAKLKPGFSVETAGKTDPSPIQPGTTIRNLIKGTGAGDPNKIELDKELIGSEEGWTFDFFRPMTDYASEAMIKLWYSWTKHYLKLTDNAESMIEIRGSVKQGSTTLQFDSGQDTNVKKLIEGMQVTGPGLKKRAPEAPNPGNRNIPEPGGIIILSIAEDSKSAILSQLADANDSGSYRFLKPQPLSITPEDVGIKPEVLYNFDFSMDPNEPARQPDVFAKKVYLIMAAMAQIPVNVETKAPPVIQLMGHVDGGTMSYIFAPDANPDSTEGSTLSAMIRDMIKSVLRGVTDFIKFPEFGPDNSQIWYPDPKDGRGGQPFNVFNLDPFVWFVHKQLGFSGYGFSLDDDTSDVGAIEATKLALTVGGDEGLDIKEEWTIQAPYGPVECSGHWDPAQLKDFGLNVIGATNTAPIVITAEKHGLKNGDMVVIDGVNGNTAANGKFSVAGVTENRFELVGSTGNGEYLGGGLCHFYYITLSKASRRDYDYWKLKGDDQAAGFLGAFLDGEGVPEQEKWSVRIYHLGDSNEGIFLLNKPLVLDAGDYTWTFRGKRE